MDYTDVKREIQALVGDGEKLCIALHKSSSPKNSEEFTFFLEKYEIWYSKSCAVIKQFLPHRLNDFSLLYRNEKRKEIKASNYTISDALRALRREHIFGPQTALSCLIGQVRMLEACLDIFDSQVYNIQTILQADIFDSEIDSAKHLLKMGFLRAAGAICGVVLEKHFSSVCERRGLVPKKKNPTIADYNDILKDNAYDTIEWRRIQRLGDIRNLCDHSKSREPRKDEVEELISGTERTIKTVF